jgi:Fe-S-cluster containining protein
MSPSMIYASLPKLPCKRKCQASCGPIMASDIEVELFQQNTGKTFPDALTVIQSSDPLCPMLDVSGQCSVYQYRPLICRLWGLVEKMRCPHGCVPDRWISDAESRIMLDALQSSDTVASHMGGR